jgi:hypothetical protein
MFGLRGPFERMTLIAMALICLGYLVGSVWAVTHHGHYNNTFVLAIFTLCGVCLFVVAGRACTT